jgi:tyrosine-protein kinase Etk/Wzc
LDSLITIGGIAFRVHNDPRVKNPALVTTSLSNAAGALSLALSARQRKSTDVIDVLYVSEDPYQAQQIVNAAVAVFRDFNAQTAQAESRRRREFLGEQVDRSDSSLRVAQEQLSEYRSREHIYGSAEQVTTQQAQLLQQDDKRQEMAADREVYRKLLATIQQSPDSSRAKALRAIASSPGIATNPVVMALYQQLIGFELIRDSLTSGEWGSAPTNPDVQRANLMIHETERRLVSAVQSTVVALDERIATLDEQRVKNSGALDAMPAKQAAEARLSTHVETIKRMTDQLRDDYQRASVSEAVEAGQVEIVDLAVKPTKPIGARLRTKLGLGLILGLFFGAGAAFIVERLNTAIRRREEIEKLLHVPGLGIIPQIMPNGFVRGRLKFAGLDLPFPQTRKSARRSMGDSAALVTSQNMRSTSAEAFRTLRTNLIFSQAVQSLRTIVITSPSPQDGKTTTATNLAVTFAQQGLRVLLADCDLRRGRLHNVFRVPREPGMTQFLAGQNTLEEVVRESTVERLWFIPAGTFPPNPSELLGSARTRELVAKLSSQYDIVILDTPPVHVAGDALILGTIVDGVILVLRAGNTERGAAQHAMQRLTNVGARVVGAVLNDPDRKVPQYGGYYYYDYYYGDESQKA